MCRLLDTHHEQEDHQEVVDQGRLCTSTKNTNHREQEREEASSHTQVLLKNLIVRLRVQVLKCAEFYRPTLPVAGARRELEHR